MNGNVTADAYRSYYLTSSFRTNGSGIGTNRNPGYPNDTRLSNSAASSRKDRPNSSHRLMGGGVSLANSSHTKHESRPLPAGPSGPQGLRGEIMSKSTLPRRSEHGYGRSASTTPSHTLPSRSNPSSFSRRTGSHSDLRMPAISNTSNSKVSTFNGRSPGTSAKNMSSSLFRSQKLTGSNSTINSNYSADGHLPSNSIRSSNLRSSPSLTSGTYTIKKDIDHLSSNFDLHATVTGHNGNNFDSRENDRCSGRAFPFERMEKRGLVGLKNLGNTCFMNSVLQCLSHSRLLLEYCLDKSRYIKDINDTTSSMKGSLFNAYADLMQKLWSNQSTSNFVTPTSFKAQIQRFAPRFMGYSQQDAQEFLRYLLQGLHEDVNRVKRKEKPIIPNYKEEDKLHDVEKSNIYWERFRRQENSYLQEIFTGQLKSTLKCDECNYCSTTFDPFWDLSLPIPKRMVNGNAQTLEDCIKLFTAEEVMDGDEKPTCARCKARRRCYKSFSIQKFPKLLVLHLKRFSGERSRSKIQSRIEYPVTGLDLSPFCANSCEQTRPVYNLYAVSCHSGSVHSGHYTAFCKHSYNGEWYDFDDTRVSAALPTRSVISAEGYVLFYELRNSSYSR